MRRIAPAGLILGLMCVLIAGCPPVTTPPDDTPAVDPSAPDHLRITGHGRVPPTYDLRWNPPADGNPVDHYIVYQSASPIPDDDVSGATATTVGGDTLSLAITLTPDTGLQHFRVSAVTLDGVEHALSPEYRVDTTARVAFLADRTLDERFELYTVSATGGDVTRVSGPLFGEATVRAYAWSPDATRIAYLADPQSAGVVELFVAPADGSAPAVRVSGPIVHFADVVDFAWSPDGRHLAFIADRRADDIFELYVTSPDGNRLPQRVSPPAVIRDERPSGVRQFAWSPDCTRLAFTSDHRQQGLYELYVTRVGSTLRQRVSGTLIPRGDDFEGVSDFAWSPDGTRLAYLANQNYAGMVEVFVVSAEGGTPRAIGGPFVPGGNVSAFAWSPDSTRVAFVADKSIDELHALWVADANGSDPVNVSGQITSNGDVDPFIAWARDGSRIVFRGDIEIDDLVALYSVDPAGGDRRRISGALLASSTVEAFAISPDSTRAAYLGTSGVTDSVELKTATLDGSVNFTVTPFLPFGANVFGFDWSPQGEALAYVADQLLVGKTELFRTDPATPGGESLRLSGAIRSDADVQDARWSPLSWDDTLGR